jgi:hypothetical protein
MKSIRLLLLSTPLICSGTTYHVDRGRGADSNSGVSHAAAWHGLEKVNASKFQPRGRVLLKSGCAWEGQLVPPSSGAEGSPIVFDWYGAGTKPRIDAAGKFDPAKPDEFDGVLKKHRQWMMQTSERHFGHVKLGRECNRRKL